jgi:translation initiation factor 3 subunit L
MSNFESGGEDNSEWQTQSSKKGWSSYNDDDSQSRHKRGDKQNRAKEVTSDESVMDITYVPEPVQQYLANFKTLLSSQSDDEYRLDELFSYYDNQFNKLSERFYQVVPWPTATLIAPLVEDGMY